MQTGKPAKAVPFTEGDTRNMTELAEYSGLVMAALMRDDRKEQHLRYSQRLDALSMQLLQVRRFFDFPWILTTPQQSQIQS